MEKINLTRTEKKILKAIRKYPCADIGQQELNGYLHFPPIEVILKALGTLTRENLIEERGAPDHGYQLTSNGEKYLSSIRFSLWSFIPSRKEIVLAVISALMGAIISDLL